MANGYSEQKDQLKAALQALKKLRAKCERLEEARNEPIAIIGMGCRIPGGANDPAAYWSLLRDGIDAIKEVPSDRWEIDNYFSPDPEAAGKMYTKWAGLIDGLDRFDAEFFGISPREAVSMDPQQRMLMEVSWEALEHSGIVPERLQGSRTGVFIGIMGNDYIQLQTKYGDPADADAYYITGTDFSSVAGRVSYYLGLQGPNFVVCAACASSLVTIHLACQSLRAGECEVALAGGVHTILQPETTIYLSRARALAADGRCKAFDAAADGFVRAEGCGMIVLKRLSRAIADNDNILALIRGSAVNHNGRSAGYTVPNGLSQQAVIRQALASAGVKPHEVSYVEAHGPGTSLGDPIEARALAAVFAAGRDRDQPLIIGSVKTNIGHMEPAAGVAGLMKVVLSMQHNEIPANLHLKSGNPHIDWREMPLRVPVERTPWPDSARRIAGINSFSLMGTNAHVVIEAYTAQSNDKNVRHAANLLTISARSRQALMEQARNYLARLSQPDSDSLTELCFSANVKRSHHDYRLALAAQSREEMAARLKAYLDGDSVSALASGVSERGPHKIAFVFPGQGSQWPGMGRQLYASQPVFREVLERCDSAMRAYVDWSLIDELLMDNGANRLNVIDRIQPALFSIQVALAALWRRWGIEPDAVIGHSMGEIGAACVAGALSLEDALKVICLRSRLLRRISGKGAMAYVELSSAAAEKAIERFKTDVAIGVSNSPGSTVLSGEPAAINRIVEQLERQAIYCRHVKVDVASHSPQVDELLDELADLLKGLQPRAGDIPIYSTVTGEIHSGEGFDAAYWVRNLRDTVRFGAMTGRLLADGTTIFIEISPHPILLPSVEQCIAHNKSAARVITSLKRNEHEEETLLAGLCELYTAGYKVDFARLYPQGGKFVPLPRYPWQRERYWLDHNSKRKPAQNGSTHPFLTSYCNSSIQPALHIFETDLNLESLPYLQDHRLQDLAVVPAALYVEMINGAANKIFGKRFIAIEQVQFVKALLLPEGVTKKIQLVFNSEDGAFQLSSLSDAVADHSTQWTAHVKGRFVLADNKESVKAIDLTATRVHCTETLSSGEHYRALAARGLNFGDAFQSVKRLWRRHGEVIGELERPASVDRGSYLLHPVLMDAGFQTLAAALPQQEGKFEGTYLPVGIARLVQHREHKRDERLLGYAQLNLDQGEGKYLFGDVYICNEAGEPVLSAEGFKLQRVDFDLHNYIDQDVRQWFYLIDWQPLKLSATYSNAGRLLVINSNGDEKPILPSDAIYVTDGPHYQRINEKQFHIDLASQQDYLRLLNDISGELSAPITGVVYLANPGCPQKRPLTDELLFSTAEYNCIGLLNLVQALAQSAWQRKPRIFIITRQALAVTDKDELELAQSTLSGLARVINHEYPELVCTHIDIGLRNSCDLPAIIEELSGNREETVVALRGSERFVPRLTRAAAIANRFHERIGLRADATYLITGGAGGIGKRLAGWFLDNGAKHLVLVGRNCNDGQLAELRRDHCKIRAAAVDITDGPGLRALFDMIDRTMPPLAGIIHAAAVLDDGILLKLDRKRFTTVMAPKVVGAWQLHQLSRDRELDLFILFSSVSSLLGFPGQGNYAAANAFLDSLAHYRQSLGLPALSINWGAWADVGLAAAQANRGERMAGRGIGSMRPDKGLTAFHEVLRAGLKQIAIMDFNVNNWQRYYGNANQQSFLEQLASNDARTLPGSKSDLRERLLDVPINERHSILENHIREQIAAVLRVAATRINVQAAIGELGFDSLMSIELRNRLQSSLGLTLSATIIWNYPSITALAGYLAAEMASDEEVLSCINGDMETEIEVPDGSDKQLEALERLEEMSEAEAEAMLMEKLARMDRERSR